MRISSENTQAIIVDVQERLFPHIHEHEALSARLQILIRGLYELRLPIVLTEQYRKGLGATIEPITEVLEAAGAFQAFEKMAFSCCDDPAIGEHLSTSGASFVVLAGIEAHICLLQTAIDLLAGGHTPVVVADATGSRRPYDREVALERMRASGAIVTTVESLLFELCRFAGTDTFRAISKLVK